ncbi:MAG: M13 family metallopeptidase [Bacteroidetes bacterium]|nr:M13 family metallopeptidase [Bacteroidota bacterium]MBL0064027.1 M13 family metallopeptidase [Bacteroidota bacterium]MBL0139586.1 M13 family metallopeptidase [Bacteroidota bacterium]
MKKLILLPAVILLFWSCASKKTDQQANVTQDDFLWQWIDTTVQPGTDFFKYATGTWMKQNPIPESERRWGIANLVRDDNYTKLRQLSDEAAADKSAQKGSNAQKIGDFWSTGMDSAAIEAQGIKPLQAQLDKINALQSVSDVVNLIADFQVNIGSPLFGAYIFQDEMNSEKYALHFYQGGIGLPDRDYYFNTDSRTANIRKEYVLHLTRMFGLLGEDGVTANRSAAAVMKIETDLAKASRKLEDLRDPYANYNKMSVGDFTKITPSIQWKDILTRMSLNNIDSVIIGQPEFYKQVEKSLNTVSLPEWKTYLRWNLVNSFADQLSSAFDKENFAFYGTVMSGVKTQRPRWKRVLDEQEGFLGDALGQLYVAKYVPQSMRERYDKLVQNMLDTYQERIKGLPWMSDNTKQKALYKLSKINRKVCFPDKWKDYSKLEISRDSYVQNVMNCRAWSYNYEVAKLYKPVDRTEWEMTPQTYNAYYNPSNNEIVLPAAQFLIPGLPDSLADDAIIYGYAAASTIGHELTHGFDDQGRQFDASGNLQNWWTVDDSVKFTKQANILVKQFSDYVVLDSLHVNGEASLGENIADLGGVVIGLEAFKKTEQFKKGEKIDGLTPLQRYFLGYTLGWLGHARDASLAMQVMTDVHAPNFLRVNGPLSNVPEFYEAFNIKDGDPMYRPDSLRVKIW